MTVHLKISRPGNLLSTVREQDITEQQLREIELILDDPSYSDETDEADDFDSLPETVKRAMDGDR